MWHHFQTWKALTSNIIGIIKDKTFFQHIREDLVNDFIVVAITNHWKTLLATLTNLGFAMVYYIMMDCYI